MEKKIYIATLLNPVDHKPYQIWFQGSNAQLRKEHLYAQTFIIIPGRAKEVGHGFLEVAPGDEEKIYEKTGCFRSHTPLGVKVKGAGLGLILYSGLCLSTAYLYASPAARKRLKIPAGLQPCIHSAYGRRTEAADKWWEKQVERKFAELTTDCDFSDKMSVNKLLEAGEKYLLQKEEDEEAEEGQEPDEKNAFFNLLRAAAEGDREDEYGDFGVNIYPFDVKGDVNFNYCLLYNILRVESILKSGMVIDLNQEIADKVKGWKFPKPEVFSDLDLTDVRDKSFVDDIHGLVGQAGLTRDQLVHFYAKNAKWFKKILQVKRGAAMAVNPSEREEAEQRWRSHIAWQSNYSKYLNNPQIL